MSLVAAILMLLGGFIALLAGAGLLRFSTPYARFHSAGKASPMAFLVAAAGAALELGWDGRVYLTIAAVAMTLTLPLGVHMMFRAVHRTTNNNHLITDEHAQAHQPPHN
ncbi:MAG: monovalent cation/H(+) antiporter subunit G [bacterium]|nr:monovalent cation/H(+) antiporter subunit G [bacterium]MCY4258316.1 monovalent cation/H(+) antiporter subunit G [bacterium]